MIKQSPTAVDGMSETMQGRLPFQCDEVLAVASLFGWQTDQSDIGIRFGLEPSTGQILVSAFGLALIRLSSHCIASPFTVELSRSILARTTDSS